MSLYLFGLVSASTNLLPHLVRTCWPCLARGWTPKSKASQLRGWCSSTLRSPLSGAVFGLQKSLERSLCFLISVSVRILRWPQVLFHAFLACFPCPSGALPSHAHRSPCHIVWGRTWSATIVAMSVNVWEIVGKRLAERWSKSARTGEHERSSQSQPSCHDLSPTVGGVRSFWSHHLPLAVPSYSFHWSNVP